MLRKVLPAAFSHFLTQPADQPKYLFIQNIVWVSANTLVRISILLLYIDIFPITKFTRACYVFLALNIAYCLEVIILRLVICVPLSFNWDNNASHGFCRGDVTHAAYVNGVINILLDVFMVMLPMPVLWSLKMATGKKIQLSFVFGLGILYVSLPSLQHTPTNHPHPESASSPSSASNSSTKPRNSPTPERTLRLARSPSSSRCWAS